MTCKVCGNPKRYIWPPVANLPNLELIKSGNMICLKMCKECGSLWVESAYNPWIGFTYIVAWNYSIDVWEYINSLDNGKTLQEWHIQEIQDHWNELCDIDKVAIESHRIRAYFKYDPIDLPKNNSISIDELIFGNKK